MKTLGQPISTAANIVLWIITAYATYIFGQSCYNMLNGDTGAIKYLNEYGDKNLRLAVAILEGIGAVMILLPRTVVLGASLLTIAVIGILTAEMSSVGGIPAQPVLMLVLALVILVGRLSIPATIPAVVKET